MIQLLSPLNTRRYLPNRKTLTDFYVPGAEQFPPARLKTFVFDFPVVATLETLEQSLPVQSDQFLWAFTGSFINAADPNAGFQVQVYHTTDGKTRMLFAKPLVGVSAVGSGPLPLLIPQTYPALAGDSFLVEVKNLSLNAAPSNIQVVLFGGELQ